MPSFSIFSLSLAIDRRENFKSTFPLGLPKCDIKNTLLFFDKRSFKVSFKEIILVISVIFVILFLEHSDQPLTKYFFY